MMTETRPKVAITQFRLIYGGRLRVVLGIVAALNQLGIIPDILTSSLAIEPQKLDTLYGRSLQANFRSIPRLPKLPGEYVAPLFNRLLWRYGQEYDLLINTNNCLIYLPPDQNVLSYIFFPRKARMADRARTIHQPDEPLSLLSAEGMRRALARRLYGAGKLHKAHRIIAMTAYTQQVIESQYDLAMSPPIIYPPVAVDRYYSLDRNRRHTIVTTGRFAHTKRQLAQIELASQLPELEFHIAGFKGDGRYFQRCQQLAAELGLTNVKLHPDAPFDQLLDLLRHSKYFLHTLVNEPFGLTTVQAIAAGCLPLVHDSGGQRETVPIKLLRYQSLADVPALIANLEARPAPERQEMVAELQTHMRAHFTEQQFNTSILDQLQTCLPVKGLARARSLN